MREIACGRSRSLEQHRSERHGISRGLLRRPPRIQTGWGGWARVAVVGLCLACCEFGGTLAAVQDPALAARQAELARQIMQYRQDVPDFPADAVWLNSKRKLSLASLRGKFVLVDFWTYCCINCMHILPELKKLEHTYNRQLVVVGVHSAKFTTEADAANIREAILRYEINHPVVVDRDMAIWNSFGCSSWPTVILLDPEGKAVWGTRGETTAEQVAAVLDALLPIYREKKLLDESPVHFELEAQALAPTPLKFPGKVLAAETSGRIFIADSNHNRIIVATPAGQVVDVIGSGEQGWADGPFASASFDHPQGMACRGNLLYVADTENHLIRCVDLDAKTVATIAGVGQQARVPFPAAPGAEPDYALSGPARECALNSPWALWLQADELFIAMAGSHQIWRLNLASGQIELYAGNGREDIVDGPLRSPTEPYELGFASFAQPSGLASDGQALFVADSEGSSIRKLPLDGKGAVETVVGTSGLPRSRLFVFGDRDGPQSEVLLQHPLGVAFGGGKLYVADTYNDKIKVIDPGNGETRTLPIQLGAAEPASLNEPGGLAWAGDRLLIADTNNHRVVAVDPANGSGQVWELSGLAPPTPPRLRPNFSAAIQLNQPATTLAPADGAVQFAVRLELPDGWKLNPDAPLRYFWEVVGADGTTVVQQPEQLLDVLPIAESFSVKVPLASSEPTTVRLAVAYYFCQEAETGLCKAGQVRWTIPVNVDPAGADRLELSHPIDPGSGE